MEEKKSLWSDQHKHLHMGKNIMALQSTEVT